MIEESGIQNELHEMAAQLRREGTSEQEIIESLQRKGVEKYYAQMILDNVKSDAEDKRQFWKHIFTGGFVFLAGLATTVATYMMAGPGHIYYIFVGIMVVGVLSITRGFILYRK